MTHEQAKENPSRENTMINNNSLVFIRRRLHFICKIKFEKIAHYSFGITR